MVVFPIDIYQLTPFDMGSPHIQPTLLGIQASGTAATLSATRTLPQDQTTILQQIRVATVPQGAEFFTFADLRVITPAGVAVGSLLARWASAGATFGLHGDNQQAPTAGGNIASFTQNGNGIMLPPGTTLELRGTKNAAVNLADVTAQLWVIQIPKGNIRQL